MGDDRVNLVNVPAGVTGGLVTNHPRHSVNSGGVQGEHANERREELHDSVFKSRCYEE
jgi:hypothetical protein